MEKKIPRLRNVPQIFLKSKRKEGGKNPLTTARFPSQPHARCTPPLDEMFCCNDIWHKIPFDKGTVGFMSGFCLLIKCLNSLSLKLHFWKELLLSLYITQIYFSMFPSKNSDVQWI